jgi:hypothetical protein
VPFFPDPEPQEQEWERLEWREPLLGEIPITIAVDLALAQTDRVALSVSAVKAHSNGCVLEVTSVAEPPDFEHRVPPAPYRFGVQWTDGAKVLLDDEHGPEEDRPNRPVLTVCGGHGSDGFTHTEFWLWPLPPPGVLQLVFDWPEQGLLETSIDFPTKPLLDAARRVAPGWETKRP